MINTINSMMLQRGIGVLYLDGTANIISKNNTADEILNSTSRLWCKGKQLCMEDSKIYASVLNFLNCGNQKSGVASFYIKKSLDQPPISLSIYPVFDDLRSEEGVKSSWLCLVKDTDKKPEFSATSMSSFYELTNAEIALVSAIYMGMSLAEHADNRGIKITTVRWTLDNIFSKTYTHSQSELRELANKFID